MGPLTAICRYPIKGLPPEGLGEVRLVADEAMPGDRRYALTHGASAFDPDRPSWVPRGNFVVVAHSPALASLRMAATGEGYQITASDGATLSFDPTLETDRSALENWIADHSGQPGPYRLIEVPRQPLHDTPLPAVSIMSDASLAALSHMAGAPLDRQRFRGNLWVDGDAPWAETGLIGKRFRIGALEFEGHSTIQRCAAIDADPATGQRDTDLCRQLHAMTGAPDFGILACVVSGGALALGDDLST